jgi:hypothetical protein
VLLQRLYNKVSRIRQVAAKRLVFVVAGGPGLLEDAAIEGAVRAWKACKERIAEKERSAEKDLLPRRRCGCNRPDRSACVERVGEDAFSFKTPCLRCKAVWLLR